MVARAALLLAVAVPASCSSRAGQGGASAEERAVVQLSAWTIGPEPSSFTRKSNLVEGARRLNRELAGEGAARRVELAADFNTTNNDAYARKVVFAFAAGRAPDIVCGGHELVGQLAAAGHLAALDPLFARREPFRADFFPLLWDAVSLGGKVYGVPQDNEVRLTYVRKDVLRRMGWSEARIDALPGQVEAGEYTLEDLAGLAEQAVARGAVARGHGVWHRNRPGFDWLQFPLAYGGELGRGGRMALPRAAAARTFALFARLTAGGATPPGMTGYSNRTAYAGFLDGRILAYLTGGSWHKREWQESFGLSEAAFQELVAYFPIPAGARGGRPVSVSHPFACMVSASARDVELAFRVVERSIDPDLDVRHALGSSHLVVRQSASRSAEYQRDPFLARMIELYRYSRLAPNHPQLARYNRILFDAIRGVEVGALGRAAAVDFMVDVGRARMGDQLEIAE